MFRLFNASVTCLLACVCVAAQDSGRANHQGVRSARSNFPPGNYAVTCTDIEMRDGTLRATCKRIDGHWIKAELSDPSRCSGGIENRNGQLACGDSNVPWVASQRVVSNWDPTITHFQHTAWDTKEGAPGQIWALAQTGDGYLWIGADSGLYRFDGVTFERYEPRSGGPLPSEAAYSLWSSNKGELWIGGHALVRVLKDGNIKTYTARDGVPDGRVRRFAEDRQGTLWIACDDGLARLEGNRWQKVGEDRNFPGRFAQTLFVDREGTLWVATENTLVFLPQGAKRFQPTRIQVGGVGQIAEAQNGRIWMAETTRSVRPVPLGGLLPPSDKTEIRVGADGILFDQDGTLWATTIGDGIRRAAHPERLSGVFGEFSDAIESFTGKDGLTDDVGGPILQDREGNVWVGTQNGLDRFRKSDFVPVVLPVPLRKAVMVAENGGDLWLQGQGLSARVIGGRAIATGNEIAKPPQQPRAAYRDPIGTIWWLCDDDLIHAESGLSEFALPEALRVQSGRQFVRFAEDRSGVIWVSASNAGLFSMKNGVWEHFEGPPALSGTAEAAYTDWMGRVWFGYDNGTIIVIENGNVQVLSPRGRFEDILAINGRGRHIWVGGTSGMAFFDGGSFHPVVPVDAGTLGTVWGIEETSDGGLWLGTAQGVIRIAESEIKRFLSDSSDRVQYRLFDSSTGLPGTFRSGWSQGEVQGTDGRLWFAASNGLAWLDPAHISRNTLPPPVAIQSLTADDKSYPYWASPALPALTGHLEIKFTALSLSIPERDHFRYKLEGYDKDWRDIGTQRQASYTNLSPRKYRFRVIASNNDGVWNEAGATLDFRVLPAWYQTIWFRSLCVAAFGLFLWGVYQLRLRQLERQFSMTLEARVNERTRIARELHDSLLQGFQGLMFRLQAVRDMLPQSSEATQALDVALERGDKAIVEGRDTVSDLRESAGDKDVAEALTALSEELAVQSDNGAAIPCVRVLVKGKPRELNPVLRDEAYRIAREALRNAFRHAKAQKIEAEITYGDSEFLLHVRDDGNGIDPEIVNRGARAGHWGLPGMRERAKSFGGKLEVWSERGSGTEIKFAVPASVAYGKPQVRRRLWFPRKKTEASAGYQQS